MNETCPKCGSKCEAKGVHIHGTSYHYECGLWIVCKGEEMVLRIIDSCRCKDRQLTALKSLLREILPELVLYISLAHSLDIEVPEAQSLLPKIGAALTLKV